MRRRSRAALGFVALALLGASVLGALRWIGAGGDLVVIDRADVPFSLLRASRPDAGDRGSDNTRRVTLFFVFQGRLVPVEREVPKDTSPLEIVELLLDGPTRDEISVGITSLLIPNAVPIGVSLAPPRAIVDLGNPFQDSLDGSRRSLTVAQIVYTLTAIEDIGSVRFLLDGEPIEVPVADGTLTGAPVTRADYPVGLFIVP